MPLLRIADACNQNCVFCGVNPEHHQDFITTLDEARTVLRESPQEEMVEISGGEPTLSPLLVPLLLELRRNERQVSLQTNAMWFATPVRTKALVKAGLKRAFVSLHNHNAARSDALTRTPGGFEKTLIGIDNLLAAGVDVSLNLVMTRWNLGDMSDYVRFVHQRFPKIQTLVFSNVNPFFNAWKVKDTLIPHVRDVIPALRDAVLTAVGLGLTPRIPDLCGLPPCLLRGLEAYSDKVENYVRGRTLPNSSDHSLLSVCPSCGWQSICDGIWQRYLDLHGEQGIEPVPAEAVSQTLDTLRQRWKVSEPTRARVLDWALSEGCTNDCLFCNEGGRKAKRHTTSLDEARSLLDQEVEPPTWISLGGGEPTLHPEIMDYAKLANESGAKRISVVSNGVKLADPTFAQTLLGSGVNEVRLSLHGSNAAIHDAITRTPGSFAKLEQALVNLHALKGQGVPLQLYLLCVVCQQNLEDLPSLVRLARTWQVDHLGFHPAEPIGLAENAWEVVPRLDHVAASLETAVSTLDAETSLTVTIDSLPPCLSEKLTPFLGQRMTIRKLDQAGDLAEEDEHRRKVYGPPCTNCEKRFTGHCEGVFHAYAEQIGWDEFGWKSKR